VSQPAPVVLPPLPTAPLDRRLRVVVLSCSDFSAETVAALVRVPEVEVVAVVRAPLPRARSLRGRLRNLYRYQGWPGLVRAPVRKLRALAAGGERPTVTSADVQTLWFADLHAPDCLAALAALDVDLGVVDGTGILRPSVFALPRFGALNLHCGKLPEYRGAPPGFWELYNGEPQVGVTVHRVTAKLDEGPIVLQTLLPLATAPAGDPMVYLDALWRTELRARGVQMLAEAVAAIARGEAVATRQPAIDAPTYRRPDYRTVQDLRRRVRERQRATP
jgi:methionyl-tRNA formyltransferase